MPILILFSENPFFRFNQIRFQAERNYYESFLADFLSFINYLFLIISPSTLKQKIDWLNFKKKNMSLRLRTLNAASGYNSPNFHFIFPLQFPASKIVTIAFINWLGATDPCSKEGHSLTFIPSINSLILFGGQSELGANDLHIFDISILSAI